MTVNIEYETQKKFLEIKKTNRAGNTFGLAEQPTANKLSELFSKLIILIY